MASNWFQPSCCFFLFAFISSSSSTIVSYNNHCSSVVPEANPTIPTHKDSIPHLPRPYFTGGERLLLRQRLRNRTYYFVGKSLELKISPDCYQTNVTTIYKVHGLLNIGLPFTYDDAPNSDTIKFSMTGFWSEDSRKLCMVGSASWEVEMSQFINLEAVLKLSYAIHSNPNIYSSVSTGILESVVSLNHPNYFDPLSIFSFSVSPNYTYSFVQEEVVDDDVLDVRPNESLSLSRDKFCSAFGAGLTVVELEYAKQCSREPRHCSPLPRSLPRVLFLNPIQCSSDEGKLRYLVKFHNMSKDIHTFSTDSVLVGEALWDDEKQQLFGVVCRLLDPSTHFGNAVEDCSMRLRLRYPSIMTIKDEAKISGCLWTTKIVEESGYFGKISLSSAHENGVVSFRERRYEYTLLDRARESCPCPSKKKKLANNNTYPNADYYNMGFDVSIKSSKGEHLSSGYASPIAVENHMVYVEEAGISDIEQVGVSEPQHRTNSTHHSKISYRIMLNQFPEVKVKTSTWFPRLNESVTLHQRADIMAEGDYDSETGELCMVGCRRLVVTSTYSFKECEILVKLEFPPLQGELGGFIKGSIKSMRAEEDPLYFDDLILKSAGRILPHDSNFSED